MFAFPPKYRVLISTWTKYDAQPPAKKKMMLNCEQNMAVVTDFERIALVNVLESRIEGRKWNSKGELPIKTKYYEPMLQTYRVLENDFVLTAKLFQMSTLNFPEKIKMRFTCSNTLKTPFGSKKLRRIGK